ncbi:hypothetical protein [Thiocapsa sp. N5-Cardenillas]|uniref:hypothetical protein n=1 Tax=Thiocapsa sp. N5-Cardenillas TaxID=3137397 RepID=UPI0035AE2D74
MLGTMKSMSMMTEAERAAAKAARARERALRAEQLSERWVRWLRDQKDHYGWTVRQFSNVLGMKLKSTENWFSGSVPPVVKRNAVRERLALWATFVMAQGRADESMDERIARFTDYRLAQPVKPSSVLEAAMKSDDWDRPRQAVIDPSPTVPAPVPVVAAPVPAVPVPAVVAPAPVMVRLLRELPEDRNWKPRV